MQKIIIKTNTMKTRHARHSSFSQPAPPQEEDCGCLCFFLGGFGPLGLIVAAIIGKASGVKSALLGWFVSWLIVGIIWFCIIGLSRLVH